MSETRLDPAKAEVLTDATERTGASVIRVSNEGGNIVIAGTVAKIMGERGPVGFAIARFPLTIPLPAAFSGVELSVEADPPLSWQVALSVPKDPRTDRSLIVDWAAPLESRPGPQRVPAAAFLPQTRGRQAAEQSLSTVLAQVRYIDFRILRSRQVPDLKAGGPFAFRLSIDPRLRLL